MAVSKKLAQLRRKAQSLGIEIKAVRDDVGWGYWLANTGWEDGNFCTDYAEIEQALNEIERDRPKAKSV